MLTNLEDISPKLRGSKIFSKLDADRGFHQIQLDEERKSVADDFNYIIRKILL